MSEPFEDQGWQLTIHHIEEAPYKSLDIQHAVYSAWILSFIDYGDVEMSVGNHTRRVRPGQLMAHPPYVPFAEHADSPGNHLWMQIEVRNRYGIDLFAVYPIAELLDIAAPDRFRELFRTCLLTWKSSEPFRRIESTALGMLLVHAVLQSWNASGRPAPVFHYGRIDARLSTVLNHIRLQLSRKISRDELASLVHLNPNYLDELFQNVFGSTPLQMLRELRLEKARNMLVTTPSTLEQIAESCGLGDAAYLSRQFRKAYGMTPGTYRSRHGTLPLKMRGYWPS